VEFVDSSVRYVRPAFRGGGPHRSILRRLALLCSVSALALGPVVGSRAGQLPSSAFQTYDPNTAGSIQAGPFALFTVPVNTIHPTQLNLGFVEVGKKTSAYDLLSPAGLANDLLTGGSIEPVVIGPGGVLYLTNGHHTFTSLQESIYGASNPNVYVNVIANYSNLTPAQFWAQMQASNFLLPLDNGVIKSVGPLTGAPIPSALTSMTNDPYRGLEYSILKNRSSVLFPNASNITGSPGPSFNGSSIPGLDKTAAFYSDFIWANAYRGANNGLGLPFISPGDIAISTKWNLTGSSPTTLQNVGAITVAQMPGYILSNNISIGTPISDATLANGVLDGNGTFTGVRNQNLGSVTIGSTAPGFIMQLGADKGFNVTLSGVNTYTGGTTILAGTLIVNNDAALGAAAPASFSIDPNNILASVQAANGITFNSLSEGKGTLQFSSSFTLNRPIAVSGESAVLNPGGNTITLAGPIVSVGPGANGLGSANGESDLTINGSGKVILAPTSSSNPLFYGNWIISGGTLVASSDAEFGNTTGPSFTIGQIVLDGGTFQAGASFSSVRSLNLTGGSTFDTNGFTTSFAGSLTDVQRTLTIINSSSANAGAVTFGSFSIGATASLALNGGTKGETVTFTNGITRLDRAILLIQPSTTTSLANTEKVLSTVAPTVNNGIVAPWIIVDSGGGATTNPYNFATYDAVNGYKVATYTKVGSGSSGGIRVAGSTDIVEQTGNATLAGPAQAYALKIDNGATITATGQTLTLGDGTNPAGLILSNSNITGGTLTFRGSEAVIYAKGNSNTISSTITGSNGLTLTGSGTLILSAASTLTGAINIDSGTLSLTAANVFANNVSGVTLLNVKSSPSNAILNFTANQTFTTLNSTGNNSTITFSNSAALTIGDTTNNLNSTLSSTITETGAAVIGALTKNGSGMLDLTGVGSGKLTLVSGSTVVVNGGVLRMSASAFANPNAIVLNDSSELQLAEGGGSVLNNAVSGTGTLHLIGGTLKLAGANSYSGGTIVEVGSTLDVTTANISTGNANITNAGGLIVFDQATSGTYSGVISDGRQMEATTGAFLSGSLVKDDSTGASSGNVTLAAKQAYTGGTFVEAGTLTLGVVDAIASSAGVDLGRVGGPLGTGAAAAGGPVTATLALGADKAIQGLMSEVGNNTAVLLNGHTLTLNTAAGTTWSFGGVISGGGALVKSGSGAEQLTGTNTYTGPTTVNGGLLSVDGSIASSSLTTINAGGALGGNGTVGNTVINGGILSPGNSIGTLTVSGSLAFTSAATYLVEVSPTGADRTNVSGAATLAGSVLAAFQPGSYLVNSYTILHSAGLGGTTFGSLTTSNLPANFSASLSYTTTDVLLSLSAALGAGTSLPGNQQNGRHQHQQFLQQWRRAAAKFPQPVQPDRRQSQQWAGADLRRDSDRRPAGRIPDDEPVSLPDARPLRRRAQRRRRRRGRRHRLCAGARGAAERHRARLCISAEGPGVQGAVVRATLGRVGRGLWRLQPHERRSGGAGQP
jgi:autotransporter-associated beta strand protein